jgi:hypothetical protein
MATIIAEKSEEHMLMGEHVELNVSPEQLLALRTFDLVYFEKESYVFRTYANIWLHQITAFLTRFK